MSQFQGTATLPRRDTAKPITVDMLANVDLIIALGSEAVVDPVPGIEIRNWDTDEPSNRGIESMERMRLARDDINNRVTAPANELDQGAQSLTPTSFIQNFG